MRVRRWVAFAALCLGLILSLVLGPARQDETRADESEAERLLELINGYRQENGVAPLVPSETLLTTAGRHSEDMATYGFFSHESKESSYYPEASELIDRTAWEGYPADTYLAENIAWGQDTAEEVFEDFRLSPDHDTNMLNGYYTAAGIGYRGSYWTVDFGS